jgi:hypothetical protein
MSEHRRYQNIKVPKRLRPTPERTSVSRTVREIRPCPYPEFCEVGQAVVFERAVTVATRSGRYWVILGAKRAKKLATEGRCQ